MFRCLDRNVQNKGPVIIYQLEGVGGAIFFFLGGGLMKRFNPKWGGGQNFIYESKAGWGGVPNMISISFSGIKTAYVHV